MYRAFHLRSSILCLQPSGFSPQPSSIPTLAGPTAVGKTALSLKLAERYPIEIISADSMQVYRRLDVGTAKPSAEERARVTHHLIDVASPDEKYDLARYLKDAAQAVDDIRRRGNIPLIVGGTGLYLKSLMTGIFAIPSRDPDIRKQLDARLAAEGPAELHKELSTIDPPTAARLSPNDAVRIIRALEVYRSTGKPISYWHANPEAPQTPAHNLRMLVLTLPRHILNERIAARTKIMLENGWVQEVRQLLDERLSPFAHSFKALGYREIARRLVNNQSLDGLDEAIAKETRQFAKRQMTWFRAMTTAQWLDLSSLSLERATSKAEKILFQNSE